MNEPRKVLKREVYRPQLEDGTKLKPIPGFTEGKTYSIFDEKLTYLPGDKESIFGSGRNPYGTHNCGISCLVRDDEGNIRYVDSHYFWKEPVLMEKPLATPQQHSGVQTIERLDVVAELLGIARQEALQVVEGVKAKKESRKPQKLDDSCIEDICADPVVDLRIAHSQRAKKKKLHWGGIDAKLEHVKETTLWQKAEDDANKGVADLKILAGLKREANSFDKADKLIESIQEYSRLMSNQIKELEFELRLLKKMAACK